MQTSCLQTISNLPEPQQCANAYIHHPNNPKPYQNSNISSALTHSEASPSIPPTSVLLNPPSIALPLFLRLFLPLLLFPFPFPLSPTSFPSSLFTTPIAPPIQLPLTTLPPSLHPPSQPLPLLAQLKTHYILLTTSSYHTLPYPTLAPYPTSLFSPLPPIY